MRPNHLIIYFCWFVSAIATFGSLFFSEIMEFPPCVLCWFQRIAMYPLFILFLVAPFRGNRDIQYYSIPFVIIGWIISLYHNLLHFEIVPEKLSPCREGVACSTVYIEIFDFLTIPMMSFLAFSFIGIGLLVFVKGKYNGEK